MNISRDPNKLTSVLNFDFKSSMLDVPKSSEAPAMSFGEILKKEADSFGNQTETPKVQETNTQVSAQNQNPSNASQTEKKEEPAKEISSTTETKVEDPHSKEAELESEEETVADSEMERMDFQFLGSIQPFLPQIPQESKLNKEDIHKTEKATSQLALLKNNERHIGYLPTPKESSNFIEDAKKLAESIFKKEKKESSGKEIPIPANAKNVLEKNVSQKEEMVPEKTFLQKGNVTFANFGRSKTQTKTNERPGNGSSLPSSISAQGKEVVKREMDTTPFLLHQTKDNHTLEAKENAPTKEVGIKKKPTTSTLEASEGKKTNGDLQALSEKNIRNLGVKDKEFSKSEPKANPSSEKTKPKEQLESISPIVSNSPQMKEDMGQSGNGSKNSSSQRDGISFTADLKFHAKTEELSKSEKPKLPSRQELQKNMDELVKQARFDIVQNGKSTAEIIMNPKEFGRLTLRVSVDGEKVDGRILVDSEEMKELVSSEISKLRENLKDSGLSLESLLVDVWEDANTNLSQDTKDQRNFAEEMMHSSSNRRSILEPEAETEGTNLSHKRMNALEVFA